MTSTGRSKRNIPLPIFKNEPMGRNNEYTNLHSNIALKGNDYGEKCANIKPWLDDRIIGIYPVRNNAPLLCSGVTHFRIIPGSTPEGGVYPA